MDSFRTIKGNKLNVQLDVSKNHTIMGNNKSSYQEAENVLNSEILRMTMTIRDYYPELAPFLKEMPETISNEKNSEITHNQLKTYSESLNSLLTRYILEHPISSK